MVTIMSPLSNLLPFLYTRSTFLKGTAYWRRKFSCYLLTRWWLEGPSLSTEYFWSFTARRPCSILPNNQRRWVLVLKFRSLNFSNWFAKWSAKFLSWCEMWEYTPMISYQLIKGYRENSPNHLRILRFLLTWAWPVHMYRAFLEDNNTI